MVILTCRRKQMDRFVSMVEAKSKLAELVGKAKYSGKRYILRRRGEPMAVLIGFEEYQRLQAETSTPALPPALRQRQEALVVRARRLEQRLGDPVDGLVAFFDELPPDDDAFWVEIQEAH
jgi:prevent-host-death family protein